jgi:hypothetical protein
MNPNNLSDEFLTKKLNEERSFFDSCIEDYFGEKFLDDFEWEKGNPLEYKVGDRIYSASISVENGKTYVRLKNNLKNFKMENIMGKGRTLFYSLPDLKEILTGEGIFSIFHELTHCWFKYKGYHDSFRNFKTSYNLMEGFCDFCAYDIINSNDKIKNIFPEAVESSEKMLDENAAVIDYVKYYPYSQYFLNDSFYPIFETEESIKENHERYEPQESFVNPFDEYGSFIREHMRARSMALFFNRKKDMIEILNNPPKTRGEVIYLSNNPI